MEIKVVHYLGTDDFATKWSGGYREVAAGVVLIFSDRNQLFIPWHRVLRIEQTFAQLSSLAEGEQFRKSLAQSMRKLP